MNGQVIIPPHRADLSHVGISANDSTFSPFPATQETWSGPKRLYVRYDTYDTAINEVCLEFKGNNIVLIYIFNGVYLFDKMAILYTESR